MDAQNDKKKIKIKWKKFDLSRQTHTAAGQVQHCEKVQVLRSQFEVCETFLLIHVVFVYILSKLFRSAVVSNLSFFCVLHYFRFTLFIDQKKKLARMTPSSIHLERSPNHGCMLPARLTVSHTALSLLRLAGHCSLWHAAHMHNFSFIEKSFQSAGAD